MWSERFRDQIRRAVRVSGLSRNAIDKRIGLDQGVMSNFMNDEGGLSRAILDRLDDVIALGAVRWPDAGPDGKG